MTDILVRRAKEVLPDIEGHIVWREAATPFTQRRFTRTSGGSAYGVEFSGSAIGPLRPGPKTEIKGLFLAGCGSRWGPAVEGSMLSGMHAAGAVLGRDLGAEVRGGLVLADPARLSHGGAGWDPLAASKPRPGRGPLERSP